MRSFLAISTALALAARAGGETLSFETVPDGTVSVIGAGPGGAPETLVSAIGFELASANETGEGEPVLARLAAGRSGPCARIGGVAYRLSVSACRSGGGTVFDFRGTPRRAPVRSAWEELEPVRVRLAARLAPSTMKGGRAIVKKGPVGRARRSGRSGPSGDRMITLGPPEKLGPDVVYPTPDVSEEKHLHEKAYGRGVELHSARGTQLFIETETPGEIEILKEEGELIIRFAEALCRPDRPFACAVFVGERPYTGPPVLLGEPEARFVEDHACFEIGVRAFGAWSDPADPEDVALRLARSRSLGFLTREFVPVMAEDDEGNEAEELHARGWPYFALRLPYTMSGNRVALSVATREGAVAASVVLPSVNTREYARMKRRLSGPTFSAPGRRGTAEVRERIARLADVGVTAARFEAFESGWALIDPKIDPKTDPKTDPDADPKTGEIDLEAAWRLDRALAEAGRRAVKLVIVHDGSGVPREALPGDPEEVRAAFRDFMTKLRYAEARWGAVQGFAASGVESPGEGRRAGGVVGYVSPVREGFRLVPHVLFRTRTRRRLWQGGVVSGSDVFTGRDVPFEDAAALARFMAAVPEVSRNMTDLTGGRQSDHYLSMSRGPRGALWFVEMALGRGNPDDAYGLVTDFDLYISGLDAGRYRLEWWDPRAGRILTSSVVRTQDGSMDLVAPPFTDEIAGRLVRIPGTQYRP